MTRILLFLACACGVAVAQTDPAPGNPARQSSPWESSIVTLEIARTVYDYNQPWTRKTRRLRKSGVVLENRQLLTTADQLFDRNLVRVQKGGRGQWFIAKVEWIDYPANLALLTTEQEDFWTNLKPAKLGPVPGTDLQIVRWREGNFESRHAEFSQFAVKEGMLAPPNHAVLELSSEIQNAGWAEAVVAGSSVVGLLVAQDGRTCSAMPTEFIQSVLDARKRGPFPGLGFFHFFWQPAENTDSLAALGLTNDARGVIIHMVPERPDREPQAIQVKDIILQIDGFDLDIQGDYLDPDLGHLNLENLATRKHWAGDLIPMKVWRDGHETNVTYKLPAYKYSDALVSFANYDRAPEFLMIGGLVFQPLDTPFLQNWGNEWKRRSPFRLHYYTTLFPAKERPSYVLLSQVLPDPYNIGYQELKHLVVDKVNGVAVNNLAELRTALEKPQNEFHVIEFVRTDGLRRLVLAAGDEESAATERVLKRYAIPQPFLMNK